MKVVWEWLKELVDPGLPVEEVAERLTMAGVEVDAITGPAGREILEFDLTPNRSDCLSHLGIAREVAALTGATLTEPEINLDESGEPTAGAAAVEIQDPERCPRYAARVVRGVTIGPSPAWMRARLESVGVRPINNVVDVTNYVLMERGHPMHAFDLARLADRRIVVRLAREGEWLTTLDEQVRRLDPDDLAICDAERPVALAGVMGGAESEVTEDTTEVLLESAFFEPAGIRRTARRHNLHTESSHRFERGADIEGVIRALDRAAELIGKLAGGEVLGGAVDVYPRPWQPTEVSLRTERLNALLGVEVEPGRIRELLEALGFTPMSAGEEGTLRFRVPSYRGADVLREIDLIEEVARLNGFHRIPARIPARAEELPAPEDADLSGRVVEALTAAGFHQAINYGFTADRSGELGQAGMSRNGVVCIRNPLSEEWSEMRTGLLPGLLKNLVHNLNQGEHDVRLFEVGTVFAWLDRRDRPAEASDDFQRSPEESRAYLPAERRLLAGVTCGKRLPGGWSTKQEEVDFFDVKGVVEELLEELGIHDLSFIADRRIPLFHPRTSCRVYAGERCLGALGEVHPEILERLDVKSKALAFELELDEMLEAARPVPTFQPLPRYPAVQRDLAMVVGERLEARIIRDALFSAQEGLGLVSEVELFDLYQGDQIRAGKKSLAYSIIYRSNERSLTDEEVNRVHGSLVALLEREFGAEPRK